MVFIALKGELIRAEDVQALASQVPFPLIADAEAIATALHETMRRFIGDARMDEEDKPGIQAQWARKVADAAERLAELVGKIEAGDVADPNDGSGIMSLTKHLPYQANADRKLELRRHAIGRAARDAFQEPHNERLDDFDVMRIALGSVEYIQRAAELTAAYWDEEKGGARSAKEPEKALFRDICAIYREAFGRKAGVGRAMDGRALPSGPAMRFCQGLLGLLPLRADEVLEPSPRDEPWRERCAKLACTEGVWKLASLIRACGRSAN